MPEDVLARLLAVRLENRKMKFEITREDVSFALAPSPWDLGNEVLYSLCHDYPKHDRGDAIIAKIWLIGRSYAAAIERRKNADPLHDFYAGKSAPVFNV